MSCILNHSNHQNQYIYIYIYLLDDASCFTSFECTLKFVIQRNANAAHAPSRRIDRRSRANFPWFDFRSKCTARTRGTDRFRITPAKVPKYFITRRCDEKSLFENMPRIGQNACASFTVAAPALYGRARARRCVTRPHWTVRLYTHKISCRDLLFCRPSERVSPPEWRRHFISLGRYHARVVKRTLPPRARALFNPETRDAHTPLTL